MGTAGGVTRERCFPTMSWPTLLTSLPWPMTMARWGLQPSLIDELSHESRNRYEL